MATVSDQRIVELCSKVISTQDSSEFQVAIEELRSALRSRMLSTRGKIADLATFVANTSKGAD